MSLGQLLIKLLTDHLDIALLGAVTIIQIAPIEINPWSRLIKWIGDTINGDLKKDISELKKDFEEIKSSDADLKRDFEQKSAKDMRWHILDFSNSCRNGRNHSREEWTHVIDQLKEYETYVREKNIDNGVIEEETKYLRDLYHERLIKNDFL